jgi:hypothetical protein
LPSAPTRRSAFPTFSIHFYDPLVAGERVFTALCPARSSRSLVTPACEIDLGKFTQERKREREREKEGERRREIFDYAMVGADVTVP